MTAELKRKKIKNLDIYTMHRSLATTSDMVGAEFSLMCVKNFRILSEHIKDLEGTLPVSAGLKQYRAKKKKLYVETEGSQSRFDTGEKKLNKEHKKDIEKWDLDQKKMLDKKSEVGIYVIKSGDLPTGMTPGLLNAIFECIDE